MEQPIFEDGPYKATLSWEAEGVRITVEATPAGLPDLTPDEIKKECDRRAKMIVDHFKILIPAAKVER